MEVLVSSSAAMTAPASPPSTPPRGSKSLLPGGISPAAMARLALHTAISPRAAPMLDGALGTPPRSPRSRLVASPSPSKRSLEASPSSEVNNVLRRLKSSQYEDRDTAGVIDEILLRSPEGYPILPSSSLSGDASDSDEDDKENAFHASPTKGSGKKQTSLVSISPSSPLRSPARNSTSSLTSMLLHLTPIGAPSRPVTMLTPPYDDDPLPTTTAIPAFYFPNGRPPSAAERMKTEEAIKTAFEGGLAALGSVEFARVCAACGISKYLRGVLFDGVASMVAMKEKRAAGEVSVVTMPQFMDYWNGVTKMKNDVESRVFAILTKGGKALTAEMLEDVVSEVAHVHPALEFLRSSPHFLQKYIETVLFRIFYDCDRGRNDRLSLSQFRSSGILECLENAANTDISESNCVFSYKHFYVIYCLFWEMDTDHDGYIGRYEMLSYDRGSVTTRAVDRVLRGWGRCNAKNNNARMSFVDFCWFLVSEVDKTTVTSIEYWFRVLDMDGDGLLSMYELEYFYEEQLVRLRKANVEAFNFEDMLCQLLDMVHPTNKDAISVADVKRCGLAPLFFDALFNTMKFLEHEAKDPSTIRRERMRPKMTDWDRFVDEEYTALLAAESNAL